MQTKFYVARMDESHIMLTIDDGLKIYTVPMSEGEFDQLLMEISVFVEGEPEVDLYYVETA